MKVFNRLHLVMLLSLLFWLQDLDAQKRGRDEAAAASSSTAMVDDSDEESDGDDHRDTRRTRANEAEEEAVGCVGAASSSGAVASSSRVAAGGGAECGGSDFPLFKGFSEICGSFLDKDSRPALWNSSSTMNNKHNNVIRLLKFDEQTPSQVMLFKISKCPRLESLDMSECVNALSAQVRAIVQQCPQLKKLNLSCCPGYAGFIEGLEEGAGEQLEELNLYWTRATVAQVRAIVQRCSQLKKLYLEGCRGSAGFIDGLEAGAGGQLEELGLGFTDATAGQVRAIVQRCSRLKKLNLRYCREAVGFAEGLLDDVGLPLEELNLNFARATAGQVRAIVQRCSPLKKLSLQYCQGSAGFAEALEEGAGEQLEELDLQSTDATAAQVRAIVQRCPQLKKLNIMSCSGAAGFIEGLETGDGEQLEELDLWYTGATADQVRAIVQRCPLLKKLYLEGCRGSAGFIEELAVGAGEQLEELDLGGTDATVAQVRVIVQRCPQLKKLNLSCCPGSAGFIEVLAAGSGELLEELYLGGTDATASQVAALRARFPRCEIRVWR